MNRRRRSIIILAAAFVPGWSLGAEPVIESGVQVGEGLGAYKTTKLGGAEDGVKVGASLCYT